MQKLDLKKEYKHLFSPSASKPDLIEVPEFRFVMIDGVINVGEKPSTSPEFQQNMQALYGVSFTLKFSSKLNKQNPIDYTVMALEGLWWVESGYFQIPMKEPWHYTLMIMQPEHITEGMFHEAVDKLSAQKDNPAISSLRFETFNEGLCVQIMHIGPYEDEPPTLEHLHSFAIEKQLKLHGKHHEIYLGDPRRTAPDKLKTILRYPVEPITV